MFRSESDVQCIFLTGTAMSFSTFCAGAIGAGAIKYGTAGVARNNKTTSEEGMLENPTRSIILDSCKNLRRPARHAFMEGHREDDFVPE